MKRFAYFLLVGSVLAINAPVRSSSATAGPEPSVPDGAVSDSMKIAGFDAEVAKEHGYEIRMDGDGKQYSVKKGTPEGAELRSAEGGRVDGDCGFSWVRINGIGNAATRLETGWHVYAPVIAFNWTVTLIDWGGVSNQTWFRPGPFAPGWWDSRDLPNMTRGPVDAQVERSSTVRLITGAFCYSGGPRDSGTIY